MLATPRSRRRARIALRRCISAGEALPEEIGERWRARFGVDILDGIGSTEMLHIFLSNRPGDVRYGTTGKPVPGLRGGASSTTTARRSAAARSASCRSRGPTSAAAYWNNREKTRATFQGAWTRSGDKYRSDADGYYIYAGRSDDMLKVGGI